MSTTERINRALDEALSLLKRPMPPEPDTDPEPGSEAEAYDATDHDPDR